MKAALLLMFAGGLWVATTEAASAGNLSVTGEARVRYESLDGQFRARGEGSDQMIAIRNLLQVEYAGPDITLGVEFQDSRAYLDDAGTPLSTSFVNPLDVLQAFVRLEPTPPPGFDEARLTLGRQTVSIGSRRVIERVEFANVIFSYTGAYLQAEASRGDELHLLAVAPVDRRPNARAALGENELSGDRESWGRTFWGVHYRRKDAFALHITDTWAEVFVYGLHERDTADLQTPDRRYVQPGFRLYRAPKVGRIDFDVEAALRRGSRRATAAATDLRDLDVRASTLHAAVGTTLDHEWRPRLSLDYDFASGDRDPSDAIYGQYERLFGSRRTDLGNTSLFGPWTPANLIAPGGRVEIAPAPNWDARIAYKAGYLAQARDVWTIARVRDPTGQSGRFIGHTIDVRTRYRFKDPALSAEVGGSVFVPGAFARSAPDSPGRTTIYGYVQLLRRF